MEILAVYICTYVIDSQEN